MDMQVRACSARSLVDHFAFVVYWQVRWCADLVSLRLFGGSDWTDDCDPSPNGHASKAASAPTLSMDPARVTSPASDKRARSRASVHRDVDNVVNFALEDVSVHMQVETIVMLHIACWRFGQTSCRWHMRWFFMPDI